MFAEADEPGASAKAVAACPSCEQWNLPQIIAIQVQLVSVKK
jgi:hypothetical protein